jgi:hypothetical protein
MIYTNANIKNYSLGLLCKLEAAAPVLRTGRRKIGGREKNNNNNIAFCPKQVGVG